MKLKILKNNWLKLNKSNIIKNYYILYNKIIKYHNNDFW